MITFAVLVWFIARFLWNPMTQMMAARTQRIAEGLAAAERGQHALEAAEQQRAQVLDQAKQHASEIMIQAERQASEIIEAAKGSARTEAERILAQARTDIGQEIGRAKGELRSAVARLAVEGAGRIIEREVDPKAHETLLKRLTEQL